MHCVNTISDFFITSQRSVCYYPSCEYEICVGYAIDSQTLFIAKCITDMPASYRFKGCAKSYLKQWGLPKIALSSNFICHSVILFIMLWRNLVAMAI